MKEIKFKIAAKDDINIVYNIENELFNNNWTKERLLKQMESNISFFRLMYICDDLVGYYWLWNIFDESQIVSFGIKKEYRNKGYGKKLFEDLIYILKKENIKSLYLEVRSKNKAAINIYQNYGLKEYRRIEKYYNNPEDDGICMKMEID